MGFKVPCSICTKRTYTRKYKRAENGLASRKYVCKPCTHNPKRVPKPKAIAMSEGIV